MNPAQRKLYFGEWKKAKEGMRAFGRDVSDDRTARMECHRSAEVPLSSSNLSNADLDKVVAVFWSWSQPANMDAQMRQQAQPALRCRWLCKRVMGLANEVEEVFQMASADQYIDGLWRRLNKEDFADPEYGTEEQWQKVIIALHYRYSQIVRRVLGPRKRGPTRHQGDNMDYPPSWHDRHLKQVQIKRYQEAQPF